jgi:tetratricopeptide (TPR) repeat protein
MWMHIFINTFIQISQSSSNSSIKSIEKETLVKELLTIYNDIKDIYEIKRFKATYSSDDAIQWYIKHEIFYTELNRALRRRNLELLVMFRFFFIDLYEQLMKKYDSQRNERINDNFQCSPPMYTVYHEQYVSSKQYQRINNSIGSFLSINSFFPASTLRINNHPSHQRHKSDNDLKYVLFNIVIYPNMNIHKYATILDDNYNKNYKKLLFIPGTIFKISNTSNLLSYFVDLELCSEDDEQFSDTIVSWKENLPIELNQSDLHWFITETDKLDHTEQYYQLLLDYLPQDHPLLMYSYFGLGNINKNNGEYQQAEKFYHKSKEKTQDRKWHAIIYTSLAPIYLCTKKIDSALRYYQSALNIYLSQTPQPCRSIAECFTNIGRIYQETMKYNQAWISFEEALVWSRKTLSHDSLDLIKPLTNLTQIYLLQGAYTGAVTNQDLALKIGQKHFKLNDPELGHLFKQMGKINEYRKEYHLALTFYHKAAEIYYYNYPQKNQYNINIRESIKLNNQKLSKDIYFDILFVFNMICRKQKLST